MSKMSKVLQRSKNRIYDWLLDFKEVDEWIKQYNRAKTQKDYLYNFSEFCIIANVTPKILLEQTPEQNETVIETVFEKMLKDKRIHRLNKMRSSVFSFLRLYNKKLEVPASERHDEFGRFRKKSESERSYAWLLEYDEINYWINNYTSPQTRRTYLRNMEYFLKLAKLTPTELLNLSEKDVLTKYTLVKQHYIQQDKTATAQNIYIVVSTFFDRHRIPIHFSKSDKVTVIDKRVEVQHIPTKEEIYQMADSSGSLRNRALILCLFQSGVRTNCIKRWTYGMVKNFLYPNLIVPVRIRITNKIDTKLKRHKIKYFYAFLQDEAAEALKTYIEWRKDVQGWQANDKDPIFVSESNIDGIKPLYTTALLEIVKNSAKAIGINPEEIWTHLLRKSCRKVLYKAPIDNDLAEAIMGHKLKGSKENYFDRHDLEWITSEYMKAPFSREGIGKLDHLEKEKNILEAKVLTLEEDLKAREKELEALKDTLATELEAVKERQKAMISTDFIDQKIADAFKMMFGEFAKVNDEAGFSKDHPIVKLLEEFGLKNVEEMEQAVESLRTKKKKKPG